MEYMIGVDVGGTFTDFSLANLTTRQVLNHKVRSTPKEPSEAIIKGIVDLIEMLEIDPTTISYLGHGTTVATNALIERKGARTALLITEGFKDILEIGNQTRPSLYNLTENKPQPLVDSEYRIEIPERLLKDGSVYKQLDVEAMRASVKKIDPKLIDSVAICFLFSYVNPEHEDQAAAVVREILPNAYISVSHEIVPEFREYPRLSTVILNSYLGPVMKKYLNNFRDSIKKLNIPNEPYITQSNGGTLSIEETIKKPVRTAISGPSAGVMASAHLGTLAGYSNLITFDMGGTSADISLIENSTPLVSVERKIDRWPARFPMLDIVTIGAGGGSIAWIDPGGAMKVGPESAGAVPGPASYGNGGTLPTVTDANVVMHRLNPQNILGGKMAINEEFAKSVITKEICDVTGLSLIDAANGIIDIVNANMVRTIRVISVERGYDPQDFTLMAFGGAGPLHAAAMAKELSIPRVLVPLSAGTLCSLGLLLTDIRSDHVRSKTFVPSVDRIDEIKNIFDELAFEGSAVLDKENVAQSDRTLHRWIDARYKKQNYELMVPVSEEELTQAGFELIVKRFHETHEHGYGYARPKAEIEFVNFRLTAVGVLQKAEISTLPSREDKGIKSALNKIGERMVYFKEAGDFVATAIYSREDMYPGDTIQGPAIVDQMDTTTVIPPHTFCKVDTYGNLILEIK